MKKILLLTISLISLTAFGQFDIDFKNKSVLDNGFQLPKSTKPNFKKTLKPRASTESLYINYVYYDSISQASSGASKVEELRFTLNSRIDTNNISYAYGAKRLSQIFTSYPYAANASGAVLTYNRTTSAVQFDSIFFDVFSIRSKLSSTDTLVIAIGKTTLGAGGVTNSFDAINNVTYLQYDTVIVNPNDTLMGYMYKKAPVNYAPGEYPIVVMYYYSDTVGNALAVAHGKMSENCSAILGIVSNYGISHYAGVVRFSDGNSRLSFYNNTQLNAPAPCSYWASQYWGIYPFAKITVETAVNVSSDQSAFCAGAQVNLLANFVGISGAPANTTYSWTPTTGLSASNIANPIATVGNTSTTYTVKAKNGTDSATRTFSVLSANIQATIANVTLTSCADTNKNIVVVPTGPTTIGTLALVRKYAWSSGGNDTLATKTKVKQGTYTVTVTNQFCSVTATGNVIMSASDTNVMDFSVDPASPCINKDVTFTNSSSKQDWKYVWRNGATQFSTLVTPTGYKFPAAGNIVVSLGSSFGACNAFPITKTVVVKAATATGCGSSISNSVQDNIQIFPNPVRDGKVYIQNDMNTTLSYKVTDILGKVISADKLVSNKDGQIDLSTVPNGIYFIELDSKGDKMIKKIVVDKQ
jgi:hypothetical protein